MHANSSFGHRPAFYFYSVRFGSLWLTLFSSWTNKLTILFSYLALSYVLILDSSKLDMDTETLTQFNSSHSLVRWVGHAREDTSGGNKSCRWTKVAWTEHRGRLYAEEWAYARSRTFALSLSCLCFCLLLLLLLWPNIKSLKKVKAREECSKGLSFSLAWLWPHFSLYLTSPKVSRSRPFACCWFRAQNRNKWSESIELICFHRQEQ